MHELTPIRVAFPRPTLVDVDDAVRRALAGIRSQCPHTGSIAVAVGSRGIANIASIVRAAVSTLRAWGLSPFIVPAMGSHGGATATGQADLLASYGIDDARMGCPVRSSMDVVTIDAVGVPHALYMDAAAWTADGILIINRVKPHTDFHARYESGLAKMAVIGLGKARQAAEMHRFGVPGLRDGIPMAAAHVLGTGKIVAGLALVENAYDETMHVEAVAADRILTREPELLEMARQHMPRLPVSDIDVLVVDRLGKDISGTGLDTNVIGRMRIAGEAEPDTPRIRAIIADDLTPASHGNATGVGLADIITRRLFERIDVDVTYTNVFTSGFLERGRIPLVAPNAREALACALRALGPGVTHPTVVRIVDTLHVSEIAVSTPIVDALRDRADVTVVGAPRALFDERGQLVPFSTSSLDVVAP